MAVVELKLLKAAMTNEGLANEQIERILIKANGGRVFTRENEFLKLMSNDKIAVRSSSGGVLSLDNFQAVFQSGISGDFKDFVLLNKLSKPRPETLAEVYKVIGDPFFEQMVGPNKFDLKDSYLNMSQFINFCADNSEWLKSANYVTVFIIIKDEEQALTVDNIFFVAVGVDRSGKLYVQMDRFESNNVWCGGNPRRVVLPQLTL